jgi:hypothetical protein
VGFPGAASPAPKFAAEGSELRMEK